MSARASDIPLLVDRFVAKLKLGKRFDRVSHATMDRLTRYAWPGNIRELENVIERTTILAKGPVLQIDDAFFHTDPAPQPPSADTLEEVERAHILRIFQDMNWVSKGNRTQPPAWVSIPIRYVRACRSSASRNPATPHSNHPNVPFPRNILGPRNPVGLSH